MADFILIQTICGLCMRSSATAENMSSSPALLKAISAGRPRQVRLLLDSGVTVNDGDDLGQTPLIRAIFIEHSKNREKIVRMILKRGAMVSIADVVGRTALAWACLYGRSTEVAFILEHSDLDLDLNRTDINGQTALFHAATSGNAAVVKLMVDAMLKYDMTVDVPDYSGISPLMQCIRLGHDVCASILIHHGKATTGLGARYPKDFIKAEMWAKKTQTKRESSRFSVTQFPPILSQASKNKLRYRENRAARSRILLSNETTGSSDEESYCVTDKQTDRSVLDSQISHCLGMTPCDLVQASILAICPSSSSESLNGSDTDDVDVFSLPELKRQGTFCSTRELHKLYTIYQDQTSPSFTHGVPCRTTKGLFNESATSSESTIDSKKGGFSRMHSWTNFKEKLITKTSLLRSRDNLDLMEDTETCNSTVSSESKSTVTLLPAISEKSKLTFQALVKGLRTKKIAAEQTSDYSAI